MQYAHKLPVNNVLALTDIAFQATNTGKLAIKPKPTDIETIYDNMIEALSKEKVL